MILENVAISDALPFETARPAGLSRLSVIRRPSMRTDSATTHKVTSYRDMLYEYG